MELFVAIFSGVLTALVIWWLSFPKGRRPPGPWGLPIVGYLPFLSSKPYLFFTQIAKRYGNIFSIRLGSMNILVLNDYQSTKEAFTQDAFIGRPTDVLIELNEETLKTGAFFGLPWKEHRRHCLHLLRDLGFGKTKMEERIQDEINELLEHFEKQVGTPFIMRPLLAPSMSNNIGSLVFGKRMKYDDPLRQMLTRSVSEGAMEGMQVRWLLFFPWVRTIMKFLGVGPTEKISNQNMEIRNYVMKEINEHEKTFNPDNIRDFIDGYLLEIQKRKSDPTFTKGMLQDLVVGFFSAGSETVRQSVEWLVLRVASDQTAQRRIQDEIQEAIGQDHSPIWQDQKKMPYTNAFIMEMMRWKTLVPINLLRYTLGDTTLSGYFVPKHTRVISNHWAIHHDLQYWGPDAEEFRPERFLTEDGSEVLKHENYIPFSIGKRACPGEPLGKVEIFLYFVSILQKFDIKMPEGKIPDFEGELGITLNPKEQAVVLTKRA